MTMKILMLNWRCPKNPKSGGAEYVTRKHLEAWTLAGHEVHWLAGGYHGAPQYEELPVSEITKKQFSQIIPSLSTSDQRPATSSPYIHLHRYGSPLTIYLLAPLLYFFKWRGNFDVVVDQIHGIPFLTPLWAWKSRKIAFIHEVAQEIWDEMLPWPVNIIGKLYERLYLLLYRHISFWVDSNSTRDDLVRYGIRSSLVHVIPCAIDLEPVTEVPEKEKTLTLIFLARLVKMKGIEDALRIITEVKKTVPEVRLWIVGGGDPNYVSYLKNMVSKLGIKQNVEFKGRVDDEEKVRLLRRAHWLLHTSVREGFGLTVLEANSQGTPVIAFDQSGLNEIVQDGVNGFLIDNMTSTRKQVINLLAHCKTNIKNYRAIARTSIDFSGQFYWAYSTIQSLSLFKEEIIQ